MSLQQPIFDKANAIKRQNKSVEYIFSYNQDRKILLQLINEYSKLLPFLPLLVERQKVVQSFISLSVRAHHHHLWRPLLAQALELETKVIRRFPNISLLGAFSIVSIDVKLGSRQQKYYKGRATIRHYANQPACPL